MGEVFGNENYPGQSGSQMGSAYKSQMGSRTRSQKGGVAGQGGSPGDSGRYVVARVLIGLPQVRNHISPGYDAVSG